MIEEIKAIKRAKVMYAKLETLQTEWDVLHKHNLIGKKFWALDKRIVNLWKSVNELPFSDYPMRSMDDLLGYIEFRELNLTQ